MPHLLRTVTFFSLFFLQYAELLPCGLVEKHNGGVLQHGPRDGDALLLSAGHLNTALSYLCVVTFRKRLPKNTQQRHKLNPTMEEDGEVQPISCIKEPLRDNPGSCVSARLM